MAKALMQFLTSKQREVYKKLLVLAYGNTMLVYKALEKYGSKDELANLHEVIQYIKENRVTKK